MGQALSPEPLTDSAEFAKFYAERFESPEADSTRVMTLELRKSFGGLYYRRFLTGHSGTGKSTELTRLARNLKDRFEFLRLSAQRELSPFSAQPFDILDVMAALLVGRVQELELEIDGKLIERVHGWFAEVLETATEIRSGEAGAEVEAGFSLAALVGLGAKVRGRTRFSSGRQKEVVQRRLQRLPELTGLCNELFLSCNRQLKEKHGKEWVFLIEDLDKKSVPEDILDTIFVSYSNIWSDLQTHLICTVPLWLAFGERGARLAVRRRALVDIPVFDAHHQRYEPGRKILRGILDKRVDPGLFEEGIQDALIQAAGGNIRDMFHLTAEAALLAEIAGQQRIGKPQADRATNLLRNEYLQRLGETEAANEIPYETKAAKLVEVYKEGSSRRLVQDPMLYRLLASRVVHEYNDTYWYGLPPLVVDILIQQGKLKDSDKGGLELD